MEISQLGEDIGGNARLSPASQGHADASPADWDLVCAAREGDRGAFEVLVQRHAPRLYHLLRRMAANEEQAADLLQEVLIHVWQRLDRFSGQSAFATWLWSVGRNRALDLLRRQQPRLRGVEDLDQAAGASPSDSLVAAERHQLLHRALQELPAEQREIIILRDFQDLDYASIASALGTAEGTVKSRLSRARAALRELLRPHLGGEDGGPL